MIEKKPRPYLIQNLLQSIRCGIILLRLIVSNSSVGELYVL